jgi:hypothetical protein
MQPYSTINSPLALSDSGPPPPNTIARSSQWVPDSSPPLALECYWEFPFYLLELVVIIKQQLILFIIRKVI